MHGLFAGCGHVLPTPPEWDDVLNRGRPYLPIVCQQLQGSPALPNTPQEDEWAFTPCLGLPWYPLAQQHMLAGYQIELQGLVALLVVCHHRLVPLLQAGLHVVNGAVPPHQRLGQQLILLVCYACRQITLVDNPLHIHTPPQTVGKLFKH